MTTQMFPKLSPLHPEATIGGDGSGGEERKTAIEEMYDAVTKRADDFIAYYVKNRTKMGKRAQRSRGFAIIVTALAGILPVLIALGPTGWDVDTMISPAWASVLLAVAGISLALDRFFGYSSSWMRFTKAGMDMQKHLDVFKVEMEALRVAWNDDRPSIQQAQEALNKCKEFVHKIDELACCETETWCDEFRSALEKFSDIKAEDVVFANAGAIEVHTPEADTMEDGWKLTVDGKPSEKHYGKTGTFNGLPAGMHRVVVEGTKDGKRVAWEKIVTVESQKVATLDLSLN